MPRRLLVPVLCVSILGTPASAQQDVENLAAFARLYGVARWFYPGDAAASLDWNRFAVLGASRVRGASTSAELERTLEELFLPLGTGIEIGSSLPPKPPAGPRDPSLVAWHYVGAGLSETATGAYSARRMNRISTAPSPAALPSTMAQVLPADSLKGRTIRMRGQARALGTVATGWAGLWLRVDRATGAPGFFDNMQDRPIRDTTWREYTIEGPIADDARQIVLGVISVGGMPVDVDGIEVAVRGTDGTWKPLPIRDASFEGPAGSAANGWAQNGPASFTRPASNAPHGTQHVRIVPPGPETSQVVRPTDSLETPVAGASIDFDLARGLKARVALSLTDADARTASPALAGLRTALESVAAPRGRDDVDVRLADIVVAWSAFRHFYPYWDDIDVDWDARLRPQLKSAVDAASTREAHMEVVRKLVSELRDGHGGVGDLTASPRGILPLQVRILEGRAVVIASDNATVPVGSVLTSINDVPAATRITKETELASGTLQWRQSRAANSLMACTIGSTTTVGLEMPNGSSGSARLPCMRFADRPTETRPDSITELRPGIWYVDLSRVRTAQLRPMLDTLAKARGVVFDLRGYPTDAGAFILPYLMRTREDSTDRWMHVARFAEPFATIAGWRSFSWNLVPATPHIAGERVFLTDGRAISYSESVMGYVRDHQLGTIIGGTTAGANGNIATFTVPGGFNVVFTGMRVTKHDGRTPYHTVGVAPEIPIAPTLAGIRAGRDEVLERALATFRTIQ